MKTKETNKLADVLIGTIIAILVHLVFDAFAEWKDSFHRMSVREGEEARENEVKALLMRNRELEKRLEEATDVRFRHELVKK